MPNDSPKEHTKGDIYVCINVDIRIDNGSVIAKKVEIYPVKRG